MLVKLYSHATVLTRALAALFRCLSVCPGGCPGVRGCLSHLSRISNAPQTYVKCTTIALQTHVKRTSNAPQTHFKRTSNAPQTLKKLKKNNVEKVCLYMLLYLHIPLYTFIYLRIALYTFIYSHIH